MPVVVSADDFFMVDGEYKFDPSKLPEAHSKCLRGFVSFLQDNGVGKVRKVTILRGIPGSGKSTFVNQHLSMMGDLVVDNTNTSVAEIAPYAALALAYGADLEIITLDVDPSVAQNVHGVPLEGVQRMAARMAEETPRLPPWWPNYTFTRTAGGEWVRKS